MLHADLLGERARLSPDREALFEVSTGARLSFAQLNQRSEQAASFLRKVRGLPSGARLAAILNNRKEFIELYFAAAKSGLVFVPINPKLAVPELVAILEHAEAALAICEEATAAKVGEAARRLGIEGLCLDEDGGRRWERCLLQASGTGSEATPKPEDLLAILYTSGTTGEPKGVMIPHRMVAFDAWATVMAWQLRAEDVTPIFTPLCHAGGLSVFLTPMMAIGGRIILHRAFEPEEVLVAMEREKATVALGVPTIWRLLSEYPLFNRVDLSHVRWFISGGAPLPLSLISRYRDRGLVLRQGYGLTEVGVNCFTMSDEEAWRKAGSIGKPFPYTRAKIAGEDGNQLPTGKIGELRLAGPHVSLGYYRNPEATSQAFDEEGFFCTADLAYRDDEGFYFIAGRKKEMFISGGINVFPAEIEAALAEHPAVEDAAVIGVPDEKWGEKGVAFVVAKPLPAISPEALKDFLRKRLAPFKVPKEFVFVESLPRTPYGKVIRSQLGQLWRALEKNQEKT